MFRASSCPSSGAYQLQHQPLVYRRNVVVAVLLVVVGPCIFIHLNVWRCTDLQPLNCIFHLRHLKLVVICVVLSLFVLFYVLFVCKCVLYYCHRVTTQLQLTNMSYHISNSHVRDSISILGGAKVSAYKQVLETLVWEVGPLQHRRFASSFFIVFGCKPKLVI